MSGIVPRTCTEVRPWGGESHGVAARQGSGATRHRLAGQGDGESRRADCPVDRGRDAPSRPLADFRKRPAYVLLGDPGSGKSTSFEAECDALGPAACLITAGDFLTFDLRAHPEWRGKTLFIDGLDEVRAGSREVRGPLDDIRRRLDALGRPAFRLSCREADWLGAKDRTSLVRVSPNDSLTVLRLDPLANRDVKRILSDRADIEDAAAFMATATEKGVSGFLKNPQCLSMLADCGDDRRRLAGEPSGTLRAGVPADGAGGQRRARGGRMGREWRRYVRRGATRCRRTLVRGVPPLGRQGLCNCRASRRRRVSAPELLRPRERGSVQAGDPYEPVQGRGRGSKPARASPCG